MITRAFSPYLVASAFSQALLLAYAIVSAIPSFLRAAETAAPAAPKDHLLFMGLDITVPGKHGSGPIVNLARGSAQIVIDGEVQTVVIRELRDVTTARAPKVSGTVLTLSEPAGVRTYSPATNPGLQVLQQQTDLAFIQDMRMATAEGIEKQVLTTGGSGAGARGRPLNLEQQQTARAQAADRSNSIQGELRSESFDPGGVANRASTSDANYLYDAYLVTFTVAAPEPIDQAFAVLLMEVRSPTTPTVSLQTVMFRSLPKLSSEPRKITIEQRGLPQGFAVDRVAVHVYAHGRELRSNLSQQSVAVTGDEAHQFLVIRYMLEHKNGNLAAVLVPDLLPADVRDYVPATEFGRSVEVHVNRDGGVESVELDPALAPGITRYVDDLVRNARFYPALLNGEPVAGQTTFTLAEFVQLPDAATVASGN